MDRWRCSSHWVLLPVGLAFLGLLLDRAVDGAAGVAVTAVGLPLTVALIVAVAALARERPVDA
jgi:hypothetical protein